LIKDKVVIITGGAGLIGREFTKAVIKQNGFAIIADKDEEKCITVKNELSKELNKNNIDYIKLDINSKLSLEKCIEFVDDKYKKIDALVNNAYPKNKNFGKSFFEIDYEDFIENLELNIGGYFLASQQFANYFQKQGYGNIVNISSIYGIIAPKFEVYDNTKMTMPVEYAIIKSGLIHFTKYLAKYLKGKNIRVNAISPGGISNNQPKEFLKAYNNYCLSKGMLDAGDLNGILIFLLSDVSRYLNGQNIIVDDGYCL
jgi:NAD(P)-dependent dehydrogenase (short-subunit alcohol dehydrogenase family)